MHSRVILFFGSIYGLLGVGMGAFGAHALKERLEASNMANVWQTAVLYELTHAVGLLALAALIESKALAGFEKHLKWAANSWIVGVLFFSGSLFALALGGPKWLGPVTPLGGLALISGWALILLEAWKRRART